MPRRLVGGRGRGAPDLGRGDLVSRVTDYPPPWAAEVRCSMTWSMVKLDAFCRGG
jgi:hypothetical protein